eukprot:jgi/Mesen1/11043/ME000099S10491
MLAHISNSAQVGGVAVGYGDSYNEMDVRLLELDESMLQELLNNGGAIVHHILRDLQPDNHKVFVTRLSIKGSGDDEAVLCTESKTFALKFVSSTNTMLLLPPLVNQAGTPVEENCGGQGDTPGAASSSSGKRTTLKVQADTAGHLELVEVAPKLDPLRSLLQERPYTPDEDFTQDETNTESGPGWSEGTQAATRSQRPAGLYTWQDLLERVQASPGQLRDALEKLLAIEIDGFWRIVEEKHMAEVLNMVILTAATNDWPCTSLPEHELVTAMEGDGFAAPVVRNVLSVYGRPAQLGRSKEPAAAAAAGGGEAEEEPGSSRALQGASEGGEGGAGLDSWKRARGETLWMLDEEKVCLQVARPMLAASGKRWRVEDFLEAWEASVSSLLQAKPTLAMLRGEALVESMGPERWLRPFPVSLLPTNPGQRFAELFQARSKWLWEDLEPYLRDLQGPGQSVESLLLRHTRRIQPSSAQPPVYCAR